MASQDQLVVKLGESNLHTLFDALYDTRVKYEAFGLQIGVSSGDIECIEADNPNKDSGKRLLEVLKVRLKQSPALTLGNINRALRTKSVNEPKVADNILENLKETPLLRPEPYSSSSDESSSDNVSPSISDTEKESLRKIFQKFFGRLCTAIKHPAEVAAELQENDFLNYSVMEDILISPESDQTKTINLVKYLQKKIDKNPCKLFIVIRLFLQIKDLKEIGRKMREATIKVSSEIASIFMNKNPYGDECTGPAEIDAKPIRKEGFILDSKLISQSSEMVCGLLADSELSPDMKNYRQYLQSVYSRRELAEADKYLPALDCPYINLALISRDVPYQDQEDRDEFARQTLHGGIDEILAKKTPIHIEDLLVPVLEEEPGAELNKWETPQWDKNHGQKAGRDKADGKRRPKPVRFVQVEGPPGIGKSTFAWEVCRKWNEINSLRKFIIILLLKLKEKWVLNATSLADLFRYEHDPKMSERIAKELSNLEMQKKLLIILDGFDEVSHSFYECSIIKQILQRQLLPYCTIILTTRPSAKAALKCICQPQVDKHVEIIGFTEEERVRFIIEVFSNKPEFQANFLKYMFFVPHIKSMMYIPLNCAIIAQVYYESQSSRHLAIPKTRTHLYKTLTHSILARHMKTKKGNRECIGVLPDNLDREDMENFNGLAKFAFECYYKDGWSKKVTFFNEDIPVGLVHFGFMKESSEMYAEKGLEKTLSFLHLSLQEYLSAWYLAHNFSTNFQADYLLMGLSLKDTHQASLKYNNSLTSMTSFNTSVKKEIELLQSLESLGDSLVEPAVFLAGITGWKYKLDICNLCHGIANENLLLRSLYEAQNPIIISQYFIDERRRNLSVGSQSTCQFNTPYDCYALSYCLANSPNQFSLSVYVSGGSDVSLVDTFVKGIDDHCNSKTPEVKNLELELCTDSTESKRCFILLAKVKFADEVERFTLKYDAKELPYSYELLQSFSNLQSLTATSYSISTIGMEWVPALQFLTELQEVHIDFGLCDCISPSNSFGYLPMVYKLREIVLYANLPTNVYDICSPTDKMIGSLLKLAERSHSNLTRIELPEKSISRETMAGVRSILLHCPNLESLNLRRTRLGYDGILFICSTLGLDTSLKHLLIHDDLQIPLLPSLTSPLERHFYREEPKRIKVLFKSQERITQSNKATCTDFLLKLNNILQSNTTLETIDIRCGLFLPLSIIDINCRELLSSYSEENSQWTGLGPFEQFNMGAVASGRSPNLRRSFSSSDLSKSKTTLFWYREYLLGYRNTEIQSTKDINFRILLRNIMKERRYSVSSFTAPDTDVLQSFSGLDPRLKKCLQIHNINHYIEDLRETYNSLVMGWRVRPQNFPVVTSYMLFLHQVMPQII